MLILIKQKLFNGEKIKDADFFLEHVKILFKCTKNLVIVTKLDVLLNNMQKVTHTTLIISICANFNLVFPIVRMIVDMNQMAQIHSQMKYLGDQVDALNQI